MEECDYMPTSKVHQNEPR